jgi:transcriptional regulator with XRE-family HTH domain
VALWKALAIIRSVAKRVTDRERLKQERNARDRDMLRHLGGRLRHLRETRGFSQERLAERAGLTSKYLGEVERVETNPSVTTLARLADALSVNVGDFFENTDDILPVPATQMDHLQEIYHSLGQAIQELVGPLHAHPHKRPLKPPVPPGR